MWGATPPRAKLTGDSGNAFEAALMRDVRSFRALAENQTLCLLGLLQHYRLKADIKPQMIDVRFSPDSDRMTAVAFPLSANRLYKERDRQLRRPYAGRSAITSSVSPASCLKWAASGLRTM
jgi:hypothetical protein